MIPHIRGACREYGNPLNPQAIDRLLQSAYKAGYREASKVTELIAANAILLAQELSCKQTAKFTNPPRG
jgi:hypothetical protein